MELACQEHGGGPPVLILHGLFGAAGNWTSVARRFGARFHVFALDLRNHGASPWAPRMDYGAMADDVAQFLGARGLERSAIIGHSMGGKAAMVLALTRPERVERLVVVDIAPVPRPPVHAQLVAALRALDVKRLARRGEADAQLKPTVPDPATRAFLLQNLVAEGKGFRWRLNLDAIDAQMDEIAGFPSFDPSVRYNGPTLVVRGGRSDYVEDGDKAAFDALFPTVRFVTIADAGHWVHAEQPEKFLAVAAPFLAGET
jgi:pimeloyl-ACP methyl ester carboxylesterase